MLGTGLLREASTKKGAVLYRIDAREVCRRG